MYPDFALTWRPDDAAFTFGFGVSPVYALEANWNYLDADGGDAAIRFYFLPPDSP